MLKNKTDIRSLGVMATTTSLLVLNWSLESFHWAPFLLACFMPMQIYVLTHNHNHLPMWKSKFMNAIQDYWLTLFYGFPTFAWIPTHNQNHHAYGNKPGDDTITYRISEKNNLFTLLSYPLVSSSNQMAANYQFIRKNLRDNPRLGYFYLSQLAILLTYITIAFVISWKKALLYIIIPHQIGLNTVLLINYVQHVHADEESQWNHSRNFTGKIMNWFMFNNGYHTIHHENPKIHWSQLKLEHDKIQHHIAPCLKICMFTYFFRTYFLGLFSKHFQTKSMRLERLAKETYLTEH